MSVGGYEDVYMPKPITRFAANEPGDAGFDPLNLARDLKGFNNLREAGGLGFGHCVRI